MENNKIFVKGNRKEEQDSTKREKKKIENIWGDLISLS